MPFLKLAWNTLARLAAMAVAVPTTAIHKLTWGASAALLTVGYVNAVAVTSLSARREKRHGVLDDDNATSSNGQGRGRPFERIGALLDEIEHTRKAEETRGFVTRSRRLHERTRRRRRG